MEKVEIHIHDSHCNDLYHFDLKTTDNFYNITEVIYDYIDRIHCLVNSNTDCSFAYAKTLDALYFEDSPYYEPVYTKKINDLLTACQEKYDKGETIFVFKGIYDSTQCWFTFRIIKKES